MRAMESRIAKLEDQTGAPVRGRFFILKGRDKHTDAEVAAFLETKGIDLQPSDTTFDLAFLTPSMERTDTELALVDTIPVTRTHEQALTDAEIFDRKIEAIAARLPRHLDA
jgi:hypothetical protein